VLPILLFGVGGARLMSTSAGVFASARMSAVSFSASRSRRAGWTGTTTRSAARAAASEAFSALGGVSRMQISAPASAAAFIVC
jgi:hypothetical protein